METPLAAEMGHRVEDVALDAGAGYSEPERRAADALFTGHYAALKRIARAKRRTTHAGQTMQTTDLLHDAYARLSRSAHFRDETHFLSSAALAMRHVLADYAKSKMRAKRGAGRSALPLETVEHFIGETGSDPVEIITVSRLLGELEALQPRLLRVVDCLYFAGYTVEETARLLSVSTKTVQRDWAKARGFLRERANLSDFAA